MGHTFLNFEFPQGDGLSDWPFFRISLIPNFALMSSLSEDDVWIQRWEKLAVGGRYSWGEFSLIVLDWEVGKPFNHISAETIFVGHQNSVSAIQLLSAKSVPDLRIVLSPLDLPEPRTADEFTQLFKLLDVPTAFLSERFQSVSHSFGGSLRSGALHNTWFHFLSRHPNIDEYNRLRVVDPAGTLNSKPPALWDRFGCYLKIDLDAHSSTLDATTSNRGLVESPVSISGPNSSACISSSKSQAGTTLRSPPSNWKRCVTFVCFGSTQDIRDRLQNLLKKGNVHDILHDPYVLIDILIDELYQLVTVHMKLLRNEFRDIENSIIQATPTPKYALDHANFPVLHNMAKDAIYLEQSLKSLHKIASSATRFHQKHLISCQCDIVMSVQNSLEYRLTVIESSQVQIDTLQKRTHNLIHLTFNLVSQRDSQVMQMESYSMHVIAGIGLLLVPIASLSAFVQTPFFKVEEVDKVRIRISSWSFLALSVSSTLAVVIGWWIFRQYWMQKRSMGRRRPQPPGDA